MEHISKGGRVTLAPAVADRMFHAGFAATGLALDLASFALDANGKLVGEPYMTFFNQPVTPCGGVRVVADAGTGSHAGVQGFSFDLARLPAAVERVVVTASIDGAGVMSQLQSGYLSLYSDAGEFARFAFNGADFASERALMVGEIYRRNGQWRFMASGQGFDGGLDVLVRHFGGVVDDAPAPAKSGVDLEKRLQQKAPQLVSLVKSATVSLQKVGLQTHRARVCLVLDISGSMGALYKRGLVQQFAERILALGCKFDDDGEIDVFLFGRNVHHVAPMGLNNWTGYVQHIIDRHPLEGDTRYGAALEAVRRFYFPDGAGGERRSPQRADLPVYVMFVTDGGTSDQGMAERQVRWSSNEAIFWQFMGIGKGRKSKSRKLASFADSDFPFLESLDELPGRLVDNANYFSVASPDEYSDAELYDLLMAEYPDWLRAARGVGLLAE